MTTGSALRMGDSFDFDLPPYRAAQHQKQM
jgi:hypothetical protein